MVVILLTSAGLASFAQDAEGEAAKKKTATSGELFDTIARMDAAVFGAFTHTMSSV